MSEPKRQVLFIAEAVTLSHVVRPMVLARALDPEKYKVYLACDSRYNFLFTDLPFPVIPIKSSIPAENILNVLSSGSPLFDEQTLDSYVKEDLQLFRDLSPDIVVGDMRQSLAVSSKLASITYLNIVNAQWSPFSSLEFELPHNPLAGFVAQPLAQFIFNFAAPVGFAFHTLPLNLVRLKYGLPPIHWDIKQVYSYGDYTLYTDVPEIIPTSGLPENHTYLGPILWSPQVELPQWWNEIPDDRPIVYLSLGSSGQPRLLEVALKALAQMPVYVMAATGPHSSVKQAPANAYLAEYLPGTQAAQRAQVVICNGGNLSGQQALAAASPVLGVVSNLDQVMFMKAVSKAGAGEMLKEEEADESEIKRQVWRMLHQTSYKESARKIAESYKLFDAPERFAALIDSIFADNKP